MVFLSSFFSICISVLLPVDYLILQQSLMHTHILCFSISSSSSASPLLQCPIVIQFILTMIFATLTVFTRSCVWLIGLAAFVFFLVSSTYICSRITAATVSRARKRPDIFLSFLPPSDLDTGCLPVAHRYLLPTAAPCRPCRYYYLAPFFACCPLVSFVPLCLKSPVSCSLPTSHRIYPYTHPS